MKLTNLKNKAPGKTDIMAQVWKSLLDCREKFSTLKSIIIKFWVTETAFNEWNIGRLIALPKKGDLSLPKNYKGIMLIKCIARNFRGQGSFLKIRAQIYGSSESQS